MKSETSVPISEEVVQFGPGGALVGIFTAAQGRRDSPNRTAVLLLNAGVLHRVGPHRLYVELARRLARDGFGVLRFDHSGVGDSPQRDDDQLFSESAIDEAKKAMDFLGREKGYEKFALAGLCSGTLTAFRVACLDSRVVGLVLLTALLEDPSSVPENVIAEAQNRRIARSYTTEKALRGRSWLRVLTGRADYRKILRILSGSIRRRLAPPPPVEAGASAVTTALENLVSRGASVLFVYSEPTVVHEYFRMSVEPAIGRLRQNGNVRVEVIRRSDHTFSSVEHRRRLFRLVEDFLSSAA